MHAVLIAIDWSEFAEKAFDWYVYHLHRKGTRVILAHYIEAEKERELRRKEAALVDLQEMYENRMLQMKIDYEWITGTGSGPGDYILETAHEQKCDMIVMGARGLGKLKKAFMGSVSDHILRKSRVPVLICRKGTVGSMHTVLDDKAFKCDD